MATFRRLVGVFGRTMERNVFFSQGLPLVLIVFGTALVLSEVRKPLFRAELNSRTRHRPEKLIPEDIQHRALNEEMELTLKELESRFNDEYEIR